jgi:sensor c-di-GMP phosphodiesterase-like protein
LRDLVIRLLKIFGPAIIVAGLPILASDTVLTRHAMRLGQAETRAVADQFLDRAEMVVGEGLTALREMKVAGHVTCSLSDRQAFALTAFRSEYIQRIGIADTDGTLLCGEPLGALVEPVELPLAEAGDPSVMIGILTGTDDRQAMVSLRTDDRFRLVALFERGAMALAAGPKAMRAGLEVGVHLEDGSAWYESMPEEGVVEQAGRLRETVSSRRYPVTVSVSSTPTAALASVAPLRVIVIVFATFCGLVTFALSLFAVLRRGGGDSFTRAIRNREFVPYYQPVYDLRDGRLVGCEVLVRWHRSDGTMVPPGQFLPYAEATGLIRDITRQLMEQTVVDCGEAYAAHPDFKLSINLTAMHFNDLEIVDDVKRIYKDSGIAFQQLCFEVTEQHPLKDLALSRTIIARIQSLGASVALDDVGTGHGGLAYLQKLGVDIIKIDKSFIDDIGTDHSAETIVDTLIELGNQLGLGIIAEGVERQDQADHLREKGVAHAQGYLFSPPLPAAAFLDLVFNAPRIPGAGAVDDAVAVDQVPPETELPAEPGEADVEGDETERRSAA